MFVRVRMRTGKKHLPRRPWKETTDLFRCSYFQGGVKQVFALRSTRNRSCHMAALHGSAHGALKLCMASKAERFQCLRSRRGLNNKKHACLRARKALQLCVLAIRQHCMVSRMGILFEKGLPICFYRAKQCSGTNGCIRISRFPLAVIPERRVARKICWALFYSPSVCFF